MTPTRFAILLLVAMLVIASVAAPARAQGDASPPTGASSRRTVLRAAHVIEPRTGKRVDNAVIVIDSGRITSVTSGGAVPRGAKVIELGNATVLP